MRSKGTATELEARRRLAFRRVSAGWARKDVAAFLGVHPVTVAKWVARHRENGDDGLAARPTPGRPRFLTPDQERVVLGWLSESPTEHGFDTDLWTARRVTAPLAGEDRTAGDPVPPGRTLATRADMTLPEPDVEEVSQAGIVSGELLEEGLYFHGVHPWLQTNSTPAVYVRQRYRCP
jgi:transposase